MAASNSSRVTVDVNWRIDAPDQVIGNNQGRFDAWSQTDTLGPQPPVPPKAPEETDGEPGDTPSAGETSI